MKLYLSHLSTVLIQFHRELLLFQTELAEKADDKKYSPYDLLNLSINDPRFTWLRKFSELIIKIDMITDDKKNSPFDAHAILFLAQESISLQSPDNENLKFAMRSDTHFMVGYGQVKKAITDFESVLKTESI